MADAYIGWEELDEPEVSAVAVPSNERLAMLLTERARLERELNRLLGREPASDDEMRENARFPMPIHTAESRMEDRRLALEEQRARAAVKRALERVRLQSRDEARRIDQKRLQERAAIQRDALQQAEARRRQESREAAGRARRVAEGIRGRWAAQRRAALRASEAARRAEWTLFDERSERLRGLAAEASNARRREEREVQAHLDRRAENGRQRRSTAARID
ncbi:hypothetical protein OM076_35995 [Solirubrobacter ginsenosidimutans]|uniref:Uncharacterized protein n=1 Tax=Solirubrobacter ginsenosidimutans TaxID=490573 RepID=A0A9X3MZ87_9ACTN|nr:hypothetical protein [Solirubrobacter ginsenosidimutans]MDA0165726.1 hypothetical protein [Solirubrobacter ginsenosidimutans]